MKQGASLLDRPDHEDVPPAIDLRHGARPGAVRIRRPRETRRGVIKRLRSMPRAIRRVSPFG